MRGAHPILKKMLKQCTLNVGTLRQKVNVSETIKVRITEMLFAGD